ncbi:MAG: translation initiation factor IF-3 [Burkholderiales bacterium]|nr:translation initiation factor IF-3 [Burkholderiales bacterium]
MIDNPVDILKQKLLAFEYGAKIKIDRSYSNFGGGAANAAVGLSHLGFKAAALVSVGKDARGGAIIDNFKKHKVDISLVQRQKAETGFSFILTGPDNEPLGVVSIMEALRLAGEADVDLVEISPTAVPPVCRLMDYGKFKYAEQKKAAEAKSKQKVIEVKEIKFRPGTDDGDYNIKLRNIKRFLEEGDKCKITLRFRGREITHQELGLALLARIRDELADLILVEQFPKLEGRQMVMMIAPGKKKVAAKPAPVAAEAVPTNA